MNKGIKVKDLIKKLQQLDQEKDIYIVYDMMCTIEFEPIVQEDDFFEYLGIKEGDYVIEAG